MNDKKKSSNKSTSEKVVLVTAILNLLAAIMEVIDKITALINKLIE